MAKNKKAEQQTDAENNAAPASAIDFDILKTLAGPIKADWTDIESVAKKDSGPKSDWNPTEKGAELIGRYAGFQRKGQRIHYGIAIPKGTDGKPQMLMICGPHTLRKMQRLDIGTPVRLTHNGEHVRNDGKTVQDITVEVGLNA